MVGQKRQGYTLLELVLVMVIVAITAAMAVPVVDGMFTGSQLHVAGDLVKSRLNEMRNRAREEGRPYKLTILDNGHAFRIEPVGDCAGVPNIQTDDELPKDIVFRLQDCLAIVNDNGESSSNPTMEVIVEANGTAPSDYEISLGAGNGLPVVVSVRGATGAISSKVSGSP